MTPAIAAIALQDPAFAARALALPRTEQHFIALVAALMGDARHDADHLAALARSYGVMARAALLEAFAETSPAPETARLVKMTGRFSGSIWRPATYRRLVALTHEKIAMRTLSHCQRITRRDILTLARLPDPFRTGKVLSMIDRPRELGAIIFAIDLVRQARRDLDDRQIEASLAKANSHDIRGWVTKHFEVAPFPAPPTEAIVSNGAETLRPLTSYADLTRAAQEFKNCIRTYLWAVLRGESYFYRYQPQTGGKGVAIVEIRRLPVAGWVVYEALGPSNADLNATDRAAIIALFRRAGLVAAPQAINPDGPWFDI